MKNYVLAAIVGLLILPQGKALGFNEYSFEPDEYLIYSTVIDDWYSNDDNNAIVIRGHTSIYQIGKPIETELEYVRKEFPSLGDKIINDFKAKNLRSYSLESFINQRAKYVIVSQKEIDYIFTEDPYWDAYFERYPKGSQGILTLSRVGFNRSRTQAILYIANQWERATGAGVCILLTKGKDGSWKIEGQERLWHSWNRDKAKP